MGDGFVLLQSSDIDIYYYQDEPGVCVIMLHMSVVQQFVWDVYMCLVQMTAVSFIEIDWLVCDMVAA